MTTKAAIRVLVVDDSSFARLVVSRQLTSALDIDVVGTAADGIEAIEQVKRLRPDPSSPSTWKCPEWTAWPPSNG